MDIAVLIPDAAVLRCQPVPNIAWIREFSNGSSVEVISEGNVTITEQADGLNKTSILTFQPTTVQDSGIYRCRAQNELNSVLSGNFHVNGYGKLSIFLLPNNNSQLCVYDLAAPRVTFPENSDVFNSL